MDPAAAGEALSAEAARPSVGKPGFSCHVDPRVIQ